MTDLPKIAVQRLHAKDAAAGIHPDPNLISAFVENALPRDSRDQIVQHLALCVECREVVFLSSPDEVATLPAAASAPSHWLTWPVLRWGAAVAAVVVVGAAISLHRQSDSISTSSDATQITGAPIAKEEAASVPLSEEKRGTAAMDKSGPVPPVATPITTKNDSENGTETRRPDQLKKQRSRVAASPMLAQNSEAAGDKIARRDELDKTATVEVHAGSMPASIDADQVVPGRAKDAAAEPASIVGGGVSTGIARGSVAAPQPRPQMFMPMVAPRWTLTSEGTLQRSLDLGRSWQTVQVASQDNFRALAASGKDIWVGGSKGALYHSADAGQHWAQVQPVAAGQALTDDIVGVEFPDPLHGKLTTVSKETWTTEDGGQSWVKP